MMIGFRVRNFRSFSIEQSLSFVASSDDSHAATHTVPTGFGALPRLNRTALVFGPNGSGKSNLLRALRTMRELVLHSSSYTQSELAARYTPFCSREWRELPTEFTIDLLLEGVRYIYSFSYDAARIRFEQLQVYKSHKAQRWFGRQFEMLTDVTTWTPFSAGFPGPREAWRTATGNQSLFLTTASELQAPSLAPLMNWFKNQFDIVLASDITESPILSTRLSDAGFKAKVLTILKAVNYPIADLRVSTAELACSASASIEFFYERHGMAPVWVDSKQDSAGARQLVLLLLVLLDVIERNKFVAIDEFDTHLHPLVARFLVATISDPAITHHRGQVLLISHSTSLLDLDLLRRDEIWLIELDNDYASNLRTLLEHRPRRHERVSNAYLRGRYGALPKVDVGLTQALLTNIKPASQSPSEGNAGKRKKIH